MSYKQVAHRAEIAEKKSELLAIQLSHQQSTNNELTKEYIKLKQKMFGLKNAALGRKPKYMLSVTEEAYLHSLPADQSNDQTFLRYAVIVLHKESKEVLATLYLCNRRQNYFENKVNTLDPEIYLELKHMFSRRLRKFQLTDIQYNCRSAKFDKLLGKALYIIRKECSRKSDEQ